MSFKDRLNNWIKENGYTRRYVASKIGMTEAGLGKFLNESSRTISISYIEELHRQFGISIDWLLTGEGEIETDLSTSEKQLLSYFNQLDESHRKDLLSIAKTFLPPADQEEASESTISQKAG